MAELFDWNAIDRRRFGTMRVIDTDQMRGRRYRCPCGWEGWTTWGHAGRHAKSCQQAGLRDPESQRRQGSR